MNRRIITIVIALASVCGGASAQPKVSGASPVCEKRGYDQRIVVDTAHVRVLYALNAMDIKDEDTYIDLGKLEVGKRVRKYSSEFLNLSDQEVLKWKKEKGWKGRVPKGYKMGGWKELSDNWSELVFSDYIIRSGKLKEYACFPLWAERENSSYTEPWPLMQWTLADEQQTILGHRCQKATCRFRGRDFVAWFATDVPIKGRGTFLITQYPDKLYPKSTRKSVWQRQIMYNEDYKNAIGWTSLEGRPTPPKIHFEPLEKE